MRKTITAAIVAAVAATTFVPAMPAFADSVIIQVRPGDQRYHKRQVRQRPVYRTVIRDNGQCRYRTTKKVSGNRTWVTKTRVCN